MLCGATGRFQRLDGANARQPGAAGAAVAVARAKAASAASASKHPTVRPMRTRVSWKVRNIPSGVAAWWVQERSGRRESLTGLTDAFIPDSRYLRDHRLSFDV